MKYKYYNPRLKNYSNQNRNNGTKSEVCLWKHVLSRGQMKNFQFHRQRPIDNYIADFVCIKASLIIEVDGYSHEDDSIKDLNRDNKLKLLGFTTLRFSAWEVLNRIADVSIIIGEWLDEHYKGELPVPRSGKKDEIE